MTIAPRSRLHVPSPHALQVLSVSFELEMRMHTRLEWETGLQSTSENWKKEKYTFLYMFFWGSLGGVFWNYYCNFRSSAPKVIVLQLYHILNEYITSWLS